MPRIISPGFIRPRSVERDIIYVTIGLVDKEYKSVTYVKTQEPTGSPQMIIHAEAWSGKEFTYRTRLVDERQKQIGAPTTKRNTITTNLVASFERPGDIPFEFYTPPLEFIQGIAAENQAEINWSRMIHEGAFSSDITNSLFRHHARYREVLQEIEHFVTPI